MKRGLKSVTGRLPASPSPALAWAAPFHAHDAGEPGGSAALAQEKRSSDGVGEST